MANQLQWTPELVRRFWNRASGSVLAELGFARVAGPQLLALLQPYLPENGRVVDYGAGAGDFTRLLLERGYKVGVFEPSTDNLPDEIISHADVDLLMPIKRSEPERSGSASPVPSQGEYDILFCLETIEHILDEELDEFFEHIGSLLRNGGLLVITTPHNEDLEKASVYCVETDKFFHPWQHVRSFTTSALEDLLDDRGYSRKRLGLADFSADAVIYDEVQALRAQIADTLPLVATLAEGRQNEAGGMADHPQFEVAFNKRWDEVREKLDAAVKPVSNHIRDIMRQHNLPDHKVNDYKDVLLESAGQLSNHVNELIRRISEVERMDTAEAIGLLEGTKPLQDVGTDIARRLSLQHAQQFANRMLDLIGRLEKASDQFIDALENARISVAAINFTPPEFTARRVAGEPVGHLSALDDQALVQLVTDVYVELLARRGQLQRAPDEFEGNLDFYRGRGQTIVYVGEKT